ncbi:recombinase RecJ [Halobacteriales archaeon QS_1_68_20]|nr:MAG: recombinase RecJ [Halobacteriales archaeon QS_1_68_20]
MSGPVPELDERATACAERLAAADRVLVASHIDADGLTSAAVAASMLRRAGIPHEVNFEKQLDEQAVARIAATDYDTVLFTDFGSGQLPHVHERVTAGDFEAVIADHHQPAAPEGVDPADLDYHLNPLSFGIDGAAELSGAGTTYVLARALAATADTAAHTDGGVTTDDGGAADDGATTDGGAGAEDNRDLAALAVVGAIGDMQASDGELVGANAAIVEEGVEAGVLEEGTDLALYGTQTRPLPKLLEYAGDVPIPGVTGDESGAIRFLDGLDVDLKADGEWRRWVDLTDDEKREVASALVQRAVSRGVPADRVNALVGTTYVLAEEEPGTELRDASEFSTLLNATARYERADVGLAVCLGDRGEAYDSARKLLRNHRRNLSRGIDMVEQEGVEQAEHVQWFHAGDRIRETIVGIVAGMAMGADGVRGDKPIVALAETDETIAVDDEEERQVDAVKVSARATHHLVRQGVDLSTVMSEAAAAVGGEGGGHDVAAGATVPAGRESDFVAAADEIVAEQLDQ